MDSGAFTELTGNGHHRHEPAAYAEQLRRLQASGAVMIEIAVAQDWMWERIMRARTLGLPFHTLPKSRLARE